MPDSSAKRSRRWSGKTAPKRVVLKLSGEALAGDAVTAADAATASSTDTVNAANPEPNASNSISPVVVDQLASEIADVSQTMEVGIAVVVGGGNIWRGNSGQGRSMERAQSDYMGMLATVINALALQDSLERQEVPTRVMTAIGMAQIAEPYIRRRAVSHLGKGRVIILAAGTGNPFFTTDTAAALRAAELEADAVLKGTHSGIAGVHTADPKLDPSAELLSEVSFLEVLSRELAVMDTAAIAVCKDNNMPIVVFDLLTPGSLRAVIEGEPLGTLVR